MGSDDKLTNDHWMRFENENGIYGIECQCGNWSVFGDPDADVVETLSELLDSAREHLLRVEGKWPVAVLDKFNFFLGFEPRRCAEHRTVGSHRAFCYQCSMWCYPASPCIGCDPLSRPE